MVVEFYDFSKPIDAVKTCIEETADLKTLD